MGKKVITLQELVRNLKQEDSDDLKSNFRTYIESSFKCSKNKDVLKYLNEKAIDDEKHHKSRTYFVYLDTNLVGFFTIALKVLDISKLPKSKKKKMIYKGKSPKNIDNIPVYLIGQIAKNDKYKRIFTGKELLIIALDKIKEINKQIGVKTIILDSVSNQNGKGKVVTFYQQNGFTEYANVIKYEAHEKDENVEEEKTIAKYLLPMALTFEDITI